MWNPVGVHTPLPQKRLGEQGLREEAPSSSFGFHLVFRKLFQQLELPISASLAKGGANSDFGALSKHYGSGTPVRGAGGHGSRFPVVVSPKARNDHRLPSANPSGWGPRILLLRGR
jgi:hypothetical protein